VRSVGGTLFRSYRFFTAFVHRIDPRRIAVPIIHALRAHRALQI
jgi:hypothetical protein